MPPGGSCDVLINPANERLVGTQFTPGECEKYLAPGTNLFYPPQAIDGLVHGARGDSSGGDSSGGAALAAAISELPIVQGEDIRCPTGSSVLTAAYGDLRECYAHVVHCVAPFYDSDRWHEQLLSCYMSAFDIADSCGAETVAVPLLGAGARGAPIELAADIAATAASIWSGSSSLCSVRFSVQDEGVASAIAAAMDKALHYD